MPAAQKSARPFAMVAFRESTLRSAARRALEVEGLETRRLFCALHDEATNTDIPLTTEAEISAELAKTVQTGKIVDHAASWYRAARTVEIATASASMSSAESSAVPVTSAITTNAAGLPLLTSRTDGAGLKIFLDFDGYGTYTPYDVDGDGTTFSATEQKNIYDAWRDVVSFFAPLNVNVTTVQPPTGGSNPVFAWQVIANNGSGTAYVGTINNSTPRGWNAGSSVTGRTSALAHELGHQLNLYHQGVWAADGTHTSEYSGGYTAHGPIIGTDYAQEIHKWIYGHTGDDVLTDDLARMATYVADRNGSIYGDGYRPDDFTGTSLAAATTLSLTDGAYETNGIIERIGDADYFKFTSAGGTYNVNVEPIFESGLAAKLELYNSNGMLIATKDTTGQRAWEDNTGQEFTLDLAAGTYTAKVSSHGDYGDQGEYAFYAAALPAGWNTQDITDDGTGRGGYVTHNGLSGAAGAFEQGGGGSFVGTGGIGSTSTSTSAPTKEDDFRFTYQILKGDGTITARVTDLANTGAIPLSGNALSGLMLRETLADDARFAFVGFSPTASRTVQRTTVAGAATYATGSYTMPGWVQITRVGNTVTLKRSTDGVNFNITSGTVTLSGLTNQVYVGLATTSGTSIELARSGFDNVSLVGSYGATAPTYNTLPAPTGLTAVPVAASTAGITAAWNAVAGATSYLIERSTDNVNWATLTTTTATTYTSTPFGSMRYWYRVSANDATGRSVPSGSVAVINKPQAPTNGLAVAASSALLSLTWRDVSGETGYRIERSNDGGVTYLASTLTTAANISGVNISGLSPYTNYTFRVTPFNATGDGAPLVFTGLTRLADVTGLSVTGKTGSSITLGWTAVASATNYLIERSTDKSTWSTLTTTGNVVAYTDTTAAPLTHYYYRLTATNSLRQSLNPSAVAFAATDGPTANPTPWVDTDIGAVSGSGAGFISNSDATVLGGGYSLVGSSSDEGNFLYRTLTGNGEMIARVASLENLNEYTKAGIWFRESLAVGSRYAGIIQQSTDDTQGTDGVYRTTLNGTGGAIQGPSDTAASWLRVVRAGNVITTYASTTGAAGSWTTVGSTTISNLAATLYVGLYASARDDAYITKATFTNVSVTPASVPTVASIVVNGGQAQRSRVTSIAVNFNGPVNLAANALSLYRTADGATTRVTDLVITASPTKNVYTLTFPALPVGSLLDGTYEIRVTAAGVTNSDGYAMAADASFSTYRLYGDADGSRTVDFNDFLALQANFGSPTAGNDTAAGLDSDGNGTIDFNDFLALQANFGKTL